MPSADLTQLDPGFASIVITRIYGLMIYETLFAWDSKLQPRPQMVREWSTSPDGLVWRFTLRPILSSTTGALHHRRRYRLPAALDAARSRPGTD